MIHIRIPLLVAVTLGLPVLGCAQSQLTVKAVNRLPIARNSQTIELSTKDLAPLGEKDLNKIHVRDSSGKELLSQAVDTDFGELHKPDIVIFQADFKPNKGEPLTSSAIDIWSKRTSKLVINDWYMVDNYHLDMGEGMDD